jgi:chromosomal replication initiation ATPase DnaA
MSDWQEILEHTADKYSVTLKDLSSDKRNRNLVSAREEAGYKLAENKCPIEKIAELLGLDIKETTELVKAHRKRLNFRRAL